VRSWEGGNGIQVAPIFKEKCPDMPKMRVLHLKVLLWPEEVAANLRISQRRVYRLCEEGTPQQVKVGNLARIYSGDALQLLPEESRNIT
jgi:hypothetical protein